MATSRKTGTNEQISTYDSAGGKDYSSLATWESATDNNLVTAAESEVLEGYAGQHDEHVEISGAITNSSYFRIIRPASGEGHSGIPLVNGDVFYVYETSDDDCIEILEDYFSLQDVVVKLDVNSSSWRSPIKLSGADSVSTIGVLSQYCANAGSGASETWNVNNSDNAYVINCLAANQESRCFVFRETGSVTVTGYLYNCTCDDDGSPNSIRTVNSDQTVEAKNVIAPNYIGGTGTINQTTCYTSAPTYVDQANDDFHLSSGDTGCIDQGTDLSSDTNFAFDDDIDGDTRSGSWDIGFDEYIAPSITIESGSYSLTGSDVTLKKSSKITIENGAYVLTGSEVTLTYEAGYLLTPDAGSYIITGSDVSLKKSSKIIIGSDTYSVSGQIASLIKNSKIDIESDSYSISGTVADLLKTYLIDIEAGAYVLTGQAVSLLKDSLVSIDSGTYAYTGFDVILLYGAEYAILADAGSYIITGSTANLIKDSIISIGTDSYSTSGQAVSLLKSSIISIGSDSYNITGQDLSLIKDSQLILDPGSYSIAGQVANLLRGYQVGLDAGSYSLTGQDVTLIYTAGYTLVSDAGSYLITGTDANLLYNRIMTLESESYSVAGQAVNLYQNRLISAGAGAYAYSGNIVDLLKDSLLILDSGVIILTGQDVVFTYSGEFIPSGKLKIIFNFKSPSVSFGINKPNISFEIK